MASVSLVEPKHQRAVLELITQFAEFGASDDDGINRLAVSSADKEVRDFLCNWFIHNGFIVRVDPVGNIFGVLNLQHDGGQEHFFCGSHLDSQPNAGKYDGALGVAFACVSALLIKQAVEDGTVKSRFGTFVVACWTGEEGSRFQPSLLGSRVFAGNMDVQDAWNRVDLDEITLKQSLSEIGYLGTDAMPRPHHYFEVHIEQGKALEKAKLPIGLVISCWGARKFELIILGKADHTGPTPMCERKDALLAAAKLIARVHDIADHSQHLLHSSVGRIVTFPNSPNTVTERAQIWVEFRAESEAELDAVEKQLLGCIEQTAIETKCEICVESREVREIITFDQAARNTASSSLDRAGIDYTKLMTISGHDAVQMQSICPSTLLFVPSRGGISHSPEEFTSNEDICKSFEASTQVMAALFSSPAVVSASGGAYA